MVTTINDLVLDSFRTAAKPSVEGLTVEKLRAARERLINAEIADYYVCIVEHYRRPRSKKRRIRKKWYLDMGNWRSRWVRPSEVPKGVQELPLGDPRNSVW